MKFLYIIIFSITVLVGAFWVKNSMNAIKANMPEKFNNDVSNGDNTDKSKSLIPAGINPYATARIAEARQLQTSIELYLTENGTLPAIGNGCQPLSVLKSALVPNYIGESKFIALSANNKFSVAVSSGGYEYVLHVADSAKSGIIAQTDTDGLILGCDCNDPNYCITEYKLTDEEIELYNDLN